MPADERSLFQTHTVRAGLARALAPTPSRLDACDGAPSGPAAVGARPLPLRPVREQDIEPRDDQYHWPELPDALDLDHVQVRQQ